MNMEELPTYQLTHLGTKICRHCVHFRTANCPSADVQTRREIRRFNWSSLSTCDAWTPNARTDEALQVLTWRKLEGQDTDDFRDREDTEPKVKDD